MTTFLIVLMLGGGTRGEGGWPGEVPDVALLLDKNGLLHGLSLPALEPLWVLATGFPTLQSLQFEPRGQPQFFPTATGALFLLKDEKSSLQKHPDTLQEIAALGCSELDQDFYFHGTTQETTLRVDIRTGQLLSKSRPSSDCSELTFLQLSHSIDLVSKSTQTPVSSLSHTQLIALSCVFQGEFLTTDDRTRLSEHQLIGFASLPVSSEESKWVLSDLKTILVFMVLSLAIGFKLGTKAASTPLHVSTVHQLQIPLADSDPSTATTGPSFSPSNSQKGVEADAQQGTEGRGQSQGSVDHHRMVLTITVPEQVAMERFELETPTSLHLPSEAQIQDLISNGRFTETFESPTLIEETLETKIFRARHRLDRKLYIVKVTKFKYEPRQKIAQLAMFREVAAMMKFRHKHIVTYVTCWVETGDSFGIISYQSLETLCGSDGEEERPLELPPRINGYLYIQSEFVQGQDLKSRLTHRNKVDRRENCLIFRQILKAVAHIHGKRIVHRGLK